MFSTQSDNCIPIYPHFYFISLFAAELEEPKIVISGKGLKQTEARRDSLLKCRNRNHGVPDSNLSGSTDCFARVSLCKTIQGFSLVLVKPTKDINDINCLRDMTEIMTGSCVKYHIIFQLREYPCNITHDIF